MSSVCSVALQSSNGRCVTATTSSYVTNTRVYNRSVHVRVKYIQTWLPVSAVSYSSSVTVLQLSPQSSLRTRDFRLRERPYNCDVSRRRKLMLMTFEWMPTSQKNEPIKSQGKKIVCESGKNYNVLSQVSPKSMECEQDTWSLKHKKIVKLCEQSKCFKSNGVGFFLLDCGENTDVEVSIVGIKQPTTFVHVTQTGSVVTTDRIWKNESTTLNLKQRRYGEAAEVLTHLVGQLLGNQTLQGEGSTTSQLTSLEQHALVALRTRHHDPKSRPRELDSIQFPLLCHTPT